MTSHCKGTKSILLNLRILKVYEVNLIKLPYVESIVNKRRFTVYLGENIFKELFHQVYDFAEQLLTMVVVILRNKTEIKRLQSTMWATLCVPSLGAMDFERIEEVSHLKKKRNRCGGDYYKIIWF